MTQYQFSHCSLNRPGDYWCTHKGAMYKEGDFDEDGYTDVVCQNIQDHQLWAIMSSVDCVQQYKASTHNCARYESICCSRRRAFLFSL